MHAVNTLASETQAHLHMQNMFKTYNTQSWTLFHFFSPFFFPPFFFHEKAREMHLTDEISVIRIIIKQKYSGTPI